MDSVFNPRSKRWIHPSVGTSEAATATTNEDFSASAGSFSHLSLLLSGCGVKAEGLDEENILSLGLDLKERAHDDRIDEINQLLRFGFDDDADKFSTVSDLSDQELDAPEENHSQSRPEIATSFAGLSTADTGPNVEQNVPNFGPEVYEAAVDQAGPSLAPSMLVKTRTVCQRKASTNLEDEPSKKKSRQQTVITTNRVRTTSEVPTDWKELVRMDLEMKSDEYEDFVNSQGFLETSSQLKDMLDFGTQKPKGFPISAKPIEQETGKDLITLKVYQNIFKPNVLAGSMATSAVDLGMYSPVEPLLTGDPVDASDKIAKVDLYFPSPSNVQYRNHAMKKFKLPGLSLSVDILLSQTVKDLFNILHCENDLVCTKDMENLDDVKQYLEKSSSSFIKSGFFSESSQNASIFVGNHLYVLNKSTESEPNYGDVLQSWKGQQNLHNSAPIEIRLMSEHELKDVNFRPGFPYLYRHHDCEHLLVFTNVRSFHPTDPSYQSAYPRLTHLHRKRPIKCGLDLNHIARVVVKNDPRLPEVSTPMCMQCCEQFCFRKNGRRVIKSSNFQLYPLLQLDNLPISFLNL